MSNTDPSSTSEFAARGFKPGTKIAGCYELKARLYETSATVVWQARDDLLNRDVTLHFLPDAVASDASTIEGLREQVKLNRQVVHPGILRVYDLVEDVECAAISMDYAEGDTLEVLKKKKPGNFFNVGEVRGWVGEICHAMEDAHGASLLHRNLTPDNVFIRKNGAVLITSFGISRTILDGMTRLQPNRKDPDLVYMSPQVLDGENPAQTDDVYSFGVLAYTLLTSRPPFHEGSLLQQIRKSVPPKMADRRGDFKVLGESIPGSWEKTIAACLSKHTEERLKSFSEIETGLGVSKSGAAVVTPAEVLGRKEAEAKTPASTTGDVPAREKSGQPSESGAKPSREATGPRKRPESAEKPRVSPFASATFQNDDRSRGRSKGGGLGVIVGVVLLALIVIGLLSIFTGDAEDERQAAEIQELTTPMNGTAGSRPVEVGVPDIYPPDDQLLAGATPEDEPSETSPPGPTPASESLPQEATADLDAAIAEADQVYQELIRKKESADAMIETARQAEEEKAAALPEAQEALDRARNAAEEAEKAREQLAAEAEEARKAADEKAKAAVAQQEKVAGSQEQVQLREETLQLLQKEVAQAKEEAGTAEASLSGLETEIEKAAAEKERLAAEATRLKAERAENEAERARRIEEARVAAEQAEQTRKQREAEQLDLDARAAEAQRAAEEAASLAEQARKALEEAERLRQASEDARRRVESGEPAPAPVASPSPTATPAPEGLPSPAASPEVSPAATPTGTPVAEAAAEGTRENSLGMRFVKVGDVRFSIWQTRLRDYEQFAAATGRAEGRWKNPGFRQDQTHPVVNVTWLDAIAFCQWLTEKEHSAGRLEENQTYRLPTDTEWSLAVGLEDEAGETPEDRDMGVPNVYPWGAEWPPPPGSGNYTGEETKSDVAIKGYQDGYVWTAPVGSFRPNEHGLYDMGGNVWEWCMDWWNARQTSKILRGASWYNGALKLSLLSSCRVRATPDSSTDNYGFRVVIANIPRATEN